MDKGARLWVRNLDFNMRTLLSRWAHPLGGGRRSSLALRRRVPRLVLRTKAVAALLPIALVVCGLSAARWRSFVAVSVNAAPRLLPSDFVPAPDVNGSWEVTSCARVDADASYRPLPRGGVLRRLANVSNAPDEGGSSSRKFLVLSGVGGGSWDMLWSDYSGAFDRPKAPNSTLFVPWREPHVPLFLVAYSRRPVDVHILQVDKKGSRAPKNGGDIVRCGERVLSAALAATCQTSTALRGSTTSWDPSRSRKDARLEVVDSEETFRYPVRKPYFLKRSDQTGTVTVCTQLTVDRLERLEALAKTFAGPISAAMYLGFRGNITEEMDVLLQFWESSTVLQRHVDLHVVFDDKKPWYAVGVNDCFHGLNPYPINFLRQFAVEHATTEWILYLEADMSTVPNAHGLIMRGWDDMMKFHQKNNGMAVFTVPIYHSRFSDSREILVRTPSNKSELISMLSPGHPRPLTKMPYMSHWKLNYREWERVSNGTFLTYHKFGNPKIIVTYKQEPYFIIRRQEMPPYNVMFMGMHNDKITQVKDTNVCGFQFFIHPDLYAINFNHDVGESVHPGASEWLDPSRTKNATWRQAYAHAMHEAYKEEVHEAMSVIDGRSFLCGSEGLRVRSSQPDPG
mmetsp:Transcript_8918/g.26712  ORF Transcript_8918/g.26712 Transcript_8918/m.26712 type:complete len:624 (-) Transcript_8918:135-2006(-)